MADPLKVYWDACVWIGLINGEAGKIGQCEDQVDLAKKGEVQLWTSTITLAAAPLGATIIRRVEVQMHS